MNRLKVFLGFQVLLIGTATYWNGWVREVERLVTLNSKENPNIASATVVAHQDRLVRNVTLPEVSRSRVYFRPRRTDALAQTHQCTQKLPLPPKYGVLELMVFEDDILRGKSCSSSNTSIEYWVCRDCGLSCAYDEWKECPVIPKRKPRCKQNKIRSWNEPSINQMTFDPWASFQPTKRKVAQYYEPYFVPWRQLEQIDCRGVTDERCFNLSRCEEDILTVNTYGGKTRAAQFLDRVIERHPDLVRREENTLDACLVVVSCDLHTYPGDAFRTYPQLVNNPHWKEGLNHFIWASYRCFRDHQDYIMTADMNFQRAALSTPNLVDINLRHGFDIPLPYFRKEMRDEFSLHTSLLESLDIHRPRSFLLNFKGLFQHMNMFWEQHRWLAFQYWENSGEILLDLKCAKKGNYRIPSDEYVEYMMNSTFVFCPGGISPGSYRFHEALAVQAIPVVTADFAAPFEPEVDWSPCLVRVSEARIVDLPRLLRESFSEHDIRKRREACYMLFLQTVGWVDKAGCNGTMKQIDHGERAFEMAIKVWAMRVKSAYARKRIAMDILESPIVADDGISR